MRPVAGSALAGLVRASTHGAAGSLVPRASSLLVVARPFRRRAAAAPAHARPALRYDLPLRFLLLALACPIFWAASEIC